MQACGGMTVFNMQLFNVKKLEFAGNRLREKQFHTFPQKLEILVALIAYCAILKNQNHF
jgi:hypothetical protein